MCEEILIASFDIGSHNFSFAIEKNKKKSKDIINDSETVFFQNLELNDKLNKNKNISYILALEKIISSEPLFLKCDIFLIEDQMKTNLIALKIQQIVLTILQLKFPTKKIIIYSSKNKTKIFNVAFQTKYQRKKWSVEKMHEIWNQRKDINNLKKIEEYPKKDDISDCVLMNISYILKYL